MTRKRHKKNRDKRSLPALNHPVRITSPAAQIVADRIATRSEGDLKQELIRILTDSAKLADEPEFTDLYLESEKTVDVTERWLKKYEKRLAAAEKKSPDTYPQVFDEMRIEVVAELSTPAFRKEVDNRLQALLDRLMATEDLTKLELVMVLKPLLGMQGVFWGVCGLILAIYNRTIQRALQNIEEEKRVFDAVLEALREEGVDKPNILTILEHPDKLKQIGQKLFEDQPELRQLAEKQIWKLEEAFEDNLAKGDVDLRLFSEEELLAPFQRLQAEFGESYLQVELSEEMRMHIMDAIRQAVTEIMTPERFQRFREEAEMTAKKWSQTRQKWAAALQSELKYLEGDQYEENKFVLAVFFGQVSRFGREHKPVAKRKKRR